ncbi:J domain-containing protein [Caulobacter sp. KR2-114]|uniref:J domain-containing protein n=1 Tax=Caulobacter sp. KR2-114 TaxID=3400912 RepID=UPI003C119C3B
MKTAFQYRPKFVDIRVRPPKPEEAAQAEDVHALKPGERPCDHADCRLAATARAPKSRDLMGEHYWFCQAHAAEYNRNWNFFAGMTEGEIRARQTDDQTTGGRPTWAFRAGAGTREAAAARGGFTDPLGIFHAAQARHTQDKAAYDRRLGKLERGALADLDLDVNADAPTIRARYTELLKRCHPDTNGGDRSAEHKLQRVVKAYKTLQKAKLV